MSFVKQCPKCRSDRNLIGAHSTNGSMVTVMCEKCGFKGYPVRTYGNGAFMIGELTEAWNESCDGYRAGLEDDKTVSAKMFKV